MPQLSYSRIDNITLTGSGTGTISFTVPTNETWILKDMFHQSAGTFSVTGISDSTGYNYTNATSANPIPNTMLKDTADDYHAFNPFADEVRLEGSNTFSIDLVETSTSDNLVSTIITIQRILPG